MCVSSNSYNRADVRRRRRAALLLLRRTAAFALALCALWTLTAALPVAAAVRTALRPPAAQPVTRAEREAPAACSCVSCSAAGAHSGGASEATCCCVPVLGEDDAAAARLSLSAFCDEGAPDAVLASVSWCPPAVLPSPATSSGDGAARLTPIQVPSPADEPGVPAPDRARPETPPRFS